ncbi:DUF262 domain-containing protein [Rhodococcus tibetensis]|uniref:DUF262 domain-containing protein n=1 Tax=Rhodococcus tibetensis TaxID=2965064 RepID=A0ABT1QHM0_9NOCA|nr:DUF262 domain-containing protein [Rhodococcus sp. FXJ9.536]MCQ4120595.1 DUF262 domain-containing protein [Rhodococcus sp. FXJ9.536]
MQRRVTSQDISWLLDLAGLKRLDLEPSYQRRSVWTRRDRQYFLDTIFNNFPSPAIFLHKDLDENGAATYHVIDGKQRLETILMFVADRISMKDDFGDARLDGKKWSKIKADSGLRKRFMDYQITVEQIDSIETTVVNDVFGRLNQNSRKLTPQEIRHARYDGWLIGFAESESESPFWKRVKVVTTGRAKRMQDTQFISELVAATIQKEILGFDQNSLDEFYAKYEFPEDLEPAFDTEEFIDQFERLKSFITEVDELNGAVVAHARNLAHFYSLWVLILLHQELRIAREFAPAYARFMNVVSEISEVTDSPEESAISDPIRVEALRYVSNARGATTDLKLRRARNDALLAGIKLALEE